MVTYKGTQYYMISRLGDLVEIAPTQHGAGSFVVHVDYLLLI